MQVKNFSDFLTFLLQSFNFTWKSLTYFGPKPPIRIRFCLILFKYLKLYWLLFFAIWFWSSLFFSLSYSSEFLFSFEYSPYFIMKLHQKSFVKNSIFFQHHIKQSPPHCPSSYFQMHLSCKVQCLMIILLFLCTKGFVPYIWLKNVWTHLRTSNFEPNSTIFSQDSDYHIW